MKTIITMIFIVLLSSCSSAGKKVIDKLYYRFPEPVVSLSNSEHPFVVKRPVALGILGNRPMVAQNSDGGLIQMRHNFWLESPKILLQNYLNKVFVFSSEQSAITDNLTVEILHLEKKQDMAILELKFVIKDKTGSVSFNRTYLHQKQLAANTIPQFVKSMADLLQLITHNFSDDLK